MIHQSRDRKFLKNLYLNCYIPCYHGEGSTLGHFKIFLLKFLRFEIFVFQFIDPLKIDPPTAQNITLKHILLIRYS